MKTLTFLFALFTFAMFTPGLSRAQQGTLSGEIYNSSAGGPSAYYNASSIPVSSTDLIEGSLPISSNYVGTHETAGGTLAVLTDGTTGVGSSAGTNSSNAAFDLGNGNWYADYALPASAGGFTLSGITVTTGHQDNRVNQQYDILVSTNGTSFFSLSDGTTQALGNAGSGFYYGPSNGSGGAAQSTVSPTGANLGTGIKYVELVVLNDGADVYREIDVNGQATGVPEPSTWAMLIVGGLGIAALRARRSVRA